MTVKLGTLQTPVVDEVELTHHPKTGAPVMAITSHREEDDENVQRGVYVLN